MQVLVSTMHQNNNFLVKKMNIKTDAIIVNQCDTEKIEFFLDKRVQWINTKTRGLSISRNAALKKANDKLCLFADDDLVYVDNYEKIIEKQFLINPEVDIITFQVEGIEKKFKNYKNRIKKLNYLGIMKVSSVEIAIRLDSIKKYNIEFNEKFGSGSLFSMGEENIFLKKCLDKNLKILYVPIKIADLHIGESTWFKGFNEKYFFDKGAIFYEMTNKYYKILILQFAIRKYRLYKKNISFKSAYLKMIEGANFYLKMKGDL